MVKDRKMGQLEVALTLEGFSGHQYPQIAIDINHQQVFDNLVVGRSHLSFNIQAQTNNQITITHYGKNNDTVIDLDGNILQDRHCILHLLKINQIEIDLNFLSHSNLYYLTDDNEHIITNYFGKNGSLTVEFEYPLWKFWHSVQSK